jgi:tRNA A37 methylthiotransferase MiaB
MLELLQVSVVQLGCPKNIVDGKLRLHTAKHNHSHAPCRTDRSTNAGEVLLGDLYKSGFEITEDHESADAIIINTCSFVGEWSVLLTSQCRNQPSAIALALLLRA